MFSACTAVKITSNRLCSIPSLPEAGIIYLRSPFSCLKHRLRDAHLQRGDPVPVCSWVLSWRQACISFTGYLYWLAVTSCLPLALAWRIYVSSYMSHLRAPALSYMKKSYIAPEHLTHLKQCTNQSMKLWKIKQNVSWRRCFWHRKW